jgi:hypothetical protein
LSDNQPASIEPQIAAYGDNVYVVWQDDGDILFKRSTNEGADFGGIKTLSTGNSFLPQIAAYGRIVYVVWGITIIGDEFEVSFKRSTNEGADFGSKKDLGKAKAPGAAMDPSIIRIAAYGRDVYVIWVSEGRNNELDIFFKGSTNRGASFDNEKNLSNNPLRSEDPEIATIRNNAYVVWEDLSPPAGASEDIFFRRIIDGGEKFGKTKDISKTEGASENPEIAAFGNNVFVAWEDFIMKGKFKDQFEILLRASNDKGDEFQPDRPRNLSKDPPPNPPNSRLDFEPTKSIAASGDYGYVAWEEETPTKIFFNRAEK